jgi:hypothetical protein
MPSRTSGNAGQSRVLGWNCAGWSAGSYPALVAALRVLNAAR